VSVWWRRRQAGREPERRGTMVWAPQTFALAGLYGQASYADVNVSTVEASLQSIAVRSAVDLLASLGSELPAPVYSGEGSERRRRPTPGYLDDPAGDGQGRADWCYQVLESWMLRGNLYGHILEWSRSGGFPTQILPLHPDLVVPQPATGGAIKWMHNGSEIPGEELLHRRVNPVPGQVLGLSPIGVHASQIGLNLAANRFGVQWFRDGAHPGGILQNTEIDLNPDVAKVAKDRFLASLRGLREPAVLGKGWKFEQVQVSPEESQFLETQGYSAAECARIFGPGVAEVLGYATGGSMTYTNVESRGAHLLVFSLNKWLRRLERLLTSMLPSPQYVRIDRDALLQSTTLDRYAAHATALQNGWKVINEVRSDEELSAVDWGDKPLAVQAKPPNAVPPKEDGA
jgi:HK97 family phage portal protein